MKKTADLWFLALSWVVSLSMNAQEKVHYHDGNAHSHYMEHRDLSEHKLIFPSHTPDRIIANLTVDPAHSFAVNWRTDQQIGTGVVEVALATDGPEFLLGNVRQVKAVSQKFQNQNRNEPLVKATYHSAVIDALDPGTTYVYRVGNGTEGYGNGYWSEW
ncbi:MAG: fibronectin type III domain-containing protein, partial [Bacteroidota bacterium]